MAQGNTATESKTSETTTGPGDAKAAAAGSGSASKEGLTPGQGSSVRPSGPSGSVAHASLVTPQGKTHIADTVVAKIAGFATREISGVHSMGRGMARRIGALRARVPGQSEAGSVTQGVSVEVGEKQAAVDIDVVTWYGESIVEVTEAVRRNVIERVQGMTGLEVVEVNINVDDIFVDDGSPSEEQAPARVQ